MNLPDRDHLRCANNQDDRSDLIRVQSRLRDMLPATLAETVQKTDVRTQSCGGAGGLKST
jgi:hypothetical protein